MHLFAQPVIRDRIVHVVRFTPTKQTVPIINNVVHFISRAWRGVLDSTLCDKECQ